jgi:hypothetical protein
MAALERAHGHASPALTPPSGRALARAEFFQTVRLILAATGRGVGDDTRADAEPVRFRIMDGMRHPDTEIVALDRPAADGPVEMTVAPMGLTGPMGVMPDHYSDLVVGQRRARDEALARFLAGGDGPVETPGESRVSATGAAAAEEPKARLLQLRRAGRSNSPEELEPS